jgi:hypothetical protein
VRWRRIFFDPSQWFSTTFRQIERNAENGAIELIVDFAFEWNRLAVLIKFFQGGLGGGACLCSCSGQSPSEQ